MGTERVVLEKGTDGIRAKEYAKHATAEYWDQLWQSTNSSYGPALEGHLPHQLRSTIGHYTSPPSRVLEAGCGLGHFTIAMHARGYEATGLDWADATVQQLQEEFPNINFQRGDVRWSPFPAEYFDVVYSPGVCEHFEEGPDAVLLDAYRILRPRGLLFVSTPYLNPLRQHRWGKDDGQPEGDFYQYLFTQPGMTATLKRLGFQVITAKAYGVWSGLALEWPALGRLSIGKAAAVLDQSQIVTRRFGSTCIWVARKP